MYNDYNFVINWYIKRKFWFNKSLISLLSTTMLLHRNLVLMVNNICEVKNFHWIVTKPFKKKSSWGCRKCDIKDS